MNEKPKRGYLSGVRAWWDRLDPIDRPMFVFFTILIIGVLLLLGGIASNTHARNHTPCTELAAWQAKDLPVRCYAYFGLSEPE